MKIYPVFGKISKSITTISLFIVIVVSGYQAESQNVAISDDDSYTADPSAMLDVKSLTKGMLVPRMTTAQREAITDPATGLLVFDTDELSFYFYSTSGWANLSSGNPSDLWTLSGSNVYLTNAGHNLGVGSTTPVGKLEVKGDASSGIDEPLFAVVNTSDDTVFAVYSEGVRIYVNDDAAKASGSKGGFAVGGFSTAKDLTNDYLWVTPDSVRIYVKDEDGGKANKGGFAVGGFSGAKGFTNEFLHVTPDSTKVMVDGSAGFKVNNIETGEEEEYLHLTPENTFIGYHSGYNTLPSGLNGIYNSFIGHEAGYSNVSGSNNVNIGYLAGQSCTSSFNILIGNEAGKVTTGDYNIFIGEQSGMTNAGGNNNVFMGFRAGQDNTNGYYNLFLGYRSGADNTTGYNNTFIGRGSGEYNTVGNNNLFIGAQAGYVSNGSGNVCIGYRAGYFETNSNKLYIENSNSTSPLIYGEFDNNMVVINGNASHNGENRTFFVNGEAGGTAAWFNDSDKKLKKNIYVIPDALKKVQQLQGVNFEWKDPEKHSPGIQMGFIAQEAENIIPEVVSNNGNKYSMQYAPITALLVEAIKEQQKIIEEQQNILDTFESDNIQLKKDTESLKAELEEIKEILNASVKN